MSKMDKTYKEKWIEALRSGQYLQGVHNLRTGDKYCCLGVLCEILIQEKKISARWALPVTLGSVYRLTDEDGAWEETFLPSFVSEPVQAPSSNFFISNEKDKAMVFSILRENYFSEDQILKIKAEGVSLTTLNDHGVSFEVIAQIIEEIF